jgi:hypothetical protein
MSTGTVNIRGKEYRTVALRVSEFRAQHPAEDGWGILTEIVDRNDQCVVVRAWIEKDGMTLATGLAEEQRASSQINRTSALENCETSAIGRALAAFGLGGSEYASANEVANAIHQQQQPMRPQPLVQQRMLNFEEQSFIERARKGIENAKCQTDLDDIGTLIEERSLPEPVKKSLRVAWKSRQERFIKEK